MYVVPFSMSFSGTKLYLIGFVYRSELTSIHPVVKGHFRKLTPGKFSTLSIHPCSPPAPSNTCPSEIFCCRAGKIPEKKNQYLHHHQPCNAVTKQLLKISITLLMQLQAAHTTHATQATIIILISIKVPPDLYQVVSLMYQCLPRLTFG